jgi:hypothetical protein
VLSVEATLASTQLVREVTKKKKRLDFFFFFSPVIIRQRPLTCRDIGSTKVRTCTCDKSLALHPSGSRYSWMCAGFSG